MTDLLPPDLAAITDAALFLDFDGTLVDFADHPDDVVVDRNTRAVLQFWIDRLDGAVAIVSGREIDDIDRFFAPLTLPTAGAHGLMRRTRPGTIDVQPVDRTALARMTEAIADFAAEHSGLLVERKQHSVALHYRTNPDLEADARRIAEAVAAPHRDFEILDGKCVVEIRSRQAGKGVAIDAFMGEMPFSGRRPVFAGDDVTDEEGFLAVRQKGGLTIKVGPGDTGAEFRLDGPAALNAWLTKSSAPTPPRPDHDGADG